ncbi:MAG TPA: DUF4962 domain-containing protein [Terriglobales bacterium]|nr:DUF4962 domain-containing protein [Terriglobales bacterium]
MRLTLRFAASLILLITFATAQDAHEALGPKDSASTRKTPHPLSALMTSLKSQIKPELRGKHPRVYFTDSELQQLREASRTTHRQMWQEVLNDVRATKSTPPPPPAEERRAQNTVGLAIAEAAFVYRIEGDKKYLDAAKKWMDAAVSYDVWGYRFNKPNVDLAAGHLLYGMGIGYDLLYSDLTPAERTRYRDKIARQAQLLADYYRPKPGRTFSYSQNHVFIPISGLAVAAYAVYDEVPEAKQWAALSRAIYDRVLATYSPDGYYYEGFEYWVFSTPWIIHYLDAHKHATGEDLYEHPGLKQAHLYLAHVILPGGETIFDFGDVYEGPITRARQGDEYARANPGWKLHTNYNLLYRLAQRYQNPDAQGVALWMREQQQVNFENWWSLPWFDAKLRPSPIQSLTPWHYFPDHEVVFWRSDWTSGATAFAFKCGPPEGHHTAEILKKFPDWHLSAGHSHPDANSFIIWANGAYLTGDSGYSGVPKTEQHNTVLVDKKGQGLEGEGHDPWRGMPYEELNKVRFLDLQLAPTFAHISGEAAGAYDGSFGVQSFNRNFLFIAPGSFYVWDAIKTSAPRTVTSLIHSDSTVKNSGKNMFELQNGTATLLLQLRYPQNASIQTEPNLVMAPGRPGSVDKGELQKRGERLAISTTQPSTETQFFVSFQVPESAKESTGK